MVQTFWPLKVILDFLVHDSKVVFWHSTKFLPNTFCGFLSFCTLLSSFELLISRLELYCILICSLCSDDIVDLQDLMVTDHVLVIGMVTVVDQEGHLENSVEKKLELLLTTILHSG